MNHLKTIYLYKPGETVIGWEGLLKIALQDGYEIKYWKEGDIPNEQAAAYFLLEIDQLDNQVLNLSEFCKEHQIPLICVVENFDENLRSFISQKHIEGWINSQISLEELRYILQTTL